MRLQAITVVIASLAKIQRETAAGMSLVVRSMLEHSCSTYLDHLGIRRLWVDSTGGRFDKPTPAGPVLTPPPTGSRNLRQSISG